jgi:hypothetical protein
MGGPASTNNLADIGGIADAVAAEWGQLKITDSDVESDTEPPISIDSSPQTVMSLSRADERSELIAVRRGLEMRARDGMSSSATLLR